MGCRNVAFAFALCVVLPLSVEVAVAQDLGHKLPGLIGLDAGRIPEPGLYLVDRVVSYRADQLRDRNGDVIPIPGLKWRAFSNAIGIWYTTKLQQSGISLTATAAVPIARFTLNIDARPEASFDRFGLADIYIQPLPLALQKEHFHV